MRHTFQDSDELEFFCTYVTERLNDQLNKAAEDAAIEPIILIAPEWLEAIIREYEGEGTDELARPTLGQ